jgi:hypothetical protein
MTTSEMVFKSARELSSLLATGHTSSVELVTAALDQIERHNHRGKKLNALIAVAPRDKALDRAAALDGERQGGVVRSALHGLPIVLKVRSPWPGEDNAKKLLGYFCDGPGARDADEQRCGVFRDADGQEEWHHCSTSTLWRPARWTVVLTV